MYLPQIAETYGVTIDDLFSRRPSGFDNSAQRLAAVFDSTHTAEDFALADEAFRTLQNQGCLSCEDLRCYAQLQQTMMNHCMEQALSLYGQIERRRETNPASRCTARRQHVHMLIQLGRPAPELDEYMRALTEENSDPEDWLALISAFQEARRMEEALYWLQLAQTRFPKNPTLCYWGGTIYQSQKQWADALSCWEQALMLEPDFTDAAYACAECHEKLGNITAAGEIWRSLAEKLERQGFTTESAYPREQARRCAV
jgi:tetratricopeptide (TPR) repeat protein